MEDFVTYELAVKLKERGFNQPCIYAYCEQGGWNMYTQKHEPITYILRTDGNPFGRYYVGKNWNVKYERNKNKIRCSAPTISQVLKWLLKDKQIYIEIGLCHDGFFAQVNTNVYWGKDFADEEELFYTSHPHQRIYGNITHEQATLAGIEYCLDTLI